MTKKRWKTKQRSGGYHIADTVSVPPRLLDNQGKFIVGGDALLFMTPYEAAEYTKEHKLNLAGLYSIIPCECSDVEQMRHTYKQ